MHCTASSPGLIIHASPSRKLATIRSTRSYPTTSMVIGMIPTSVSMSSHSSQGLSSPFGTTNPTSPPFICSNFSFLVFRSCPQSTIDPPPRSCYPPLGVAIPSLLSQWSLVNLLPVAFTTGPPSLRLQFFFLSSTLRAPSHK